MHGPFSLHIFCGMEDQGLSEGLKNRSAAVVVAALYMFFMFTV